MIILIGPSASGKTEIAHEMMKQYNMKRFVTCTTRPLREGEQDGVDYHFLSVDEFKQKIDNNEFVEWIEYNGNYYGSLKNEIGKDKIIIIDPQGLKAYLETYSDEVTIFYISALTNTRYQRMVKRGDKERVIDCRLSNDDLLFNKENISRIDYVIDNNSNDLRIAAREIYNKYKNGDKNNGK